MIWGGTPVGYRRRRSMMRHQHTGADHANMRGMPVLSEAESKRLLASFGAVTALSHLWGYAR